MISGNVGSGIFLGAPPAYTNTSDVTTDRDGDGIVDSIGDHRLGHHLRGGAGACSGRGDQHDGWRLCHGQRRGQRQQRLRG